MFAEAGALTTWSPQIFETNTFDLISRDDVADRAQVLLRREQNCKRSTPEDVLDIMSSVPPFPVTSDLYKSRDTYGNFLRLVRPTDPC